MVKEMILEIDKSGDIHSLYSDDLLLQEIGNIHNMRRASNIDFDETTQMFQVIDANTGQIVHTNKNRDKAIEWEIEHFQPGGDLCHV